MGQRNSKVPFVYLLKNMLMARRAKISQKQITQFLIFIGEVCPWFPRGYDKCTDMRKSERRDKRVLYNTWS